MSDTPTNNNLSQLIISLIVLTLIAGIIGWFLGSHLGKSVYPKEEPAPEVYSQTGESSDALDLATSSDIVKLPTLLTNLANPQTKRIRLDLSLVIPKTEKISTSESAEIASDFLLFLRTSTLDQIKGPSGLFYLKEDLLNRARVRSHGKVVALLLSGLVIE